MRHLVALIVFVYATLLSSHPALAQFSQQGPKLVGTGAVGTAQQGQPVSLSADGNTAIVGGYGDNNFAGAVWIWTRSGGVWTQQGNKLVGSGAVGLAEQGRSVSLSADGNTAIIGGPADGEKSDRGGGSIGAAWVWTRSGGVWTQQGPKLVGSGAVGTASQGWSVSVSADGNTAIVGGFSDNYNGALADGAVWIWTRSGGVWTQQGPKLVGSGAVGTAEQGWSVSLSGDGNTAIVGGRLDNNYRGSSSATGAAWVWTRSGGVWTQQGTKLVGSGAVGDAHQGSSVSLSGDGNTAIVGGDLDNDSSYAGAAWVWTRSGGVWTQQGPKLVGSDTVGNAYQGGSVSLSADGNTAIVGGYGDNRYAGAAWVWTRSGGVWTQQGPKLVGSGAVSWNALQGSSVSLSANGSTAIVGGYGDNSFAGAAWVFAASIPSSPMPLLPGGSTEGQTISTVTPTFQWTTSTGATQYTLSVSRYPYGSSYVVYSNAALSGTSFAMPPNVLVNGERYRWEMTARNTAGESGPSSSLYFQVVLNGIPAPPPASVALTPGVGWSPGAAIANSTPTLQWTLAGGATQYNLVISREPYGAGDVVYSSPDLPTATTSFTLPANTVSGGIRYRWKVTASNSGGQSVSNTLYFVIQDSTDVRPGAPVNLKTTWVSGHVAVSWTDVATNETGFKIERRDPQGTYGQIAVQGANINFFTDSTTATTAGYCYRARATNGVGDSDFSNESCIAPVSPGTSAQHLQFSAASYIAGVPGNVSITITRTGGSSGTIGATLLVSAGTAISGRDYSPLATSEISFAPGQTSKTVAPVRVLTNQPTDDRTVNLRLTGLTGDVSLGSPGNAFITIRGKTPPATLGTIFVFDPVCTHFSSTPYAQNFPVCSGELLKSDGFPDPNKLGQITVPRRGAVADGVTLLLLKLVTTDPVTFSLRRGDNSAGSAYGTLMRIDGTGRGQSVRVTPTGSTAFALFQAPPDFPLPTDGEVAVSVAATDDSSTEFATATVHLKRVPVVLIHGIWSDRQAFQTLDTYLAAAGFFVYRADYSQDPAGSFDPKKFSVPIASLEAAVEQALDLARSDGDDGLAASQVDVVAHSMGGLVARAREKDNGGAYVAIDPTTHAARSQSRTKFSRNENRGKGEFHKLITIGTPHYGTPLANWFADNRTLRVGKDENGKDVNLSQFLKGQKREVGPAIDQFLTNSELLQRLGTSVPIHLIAGREPTAATAITEKNLNVVLNNIAGSCDTIDSILRGAALAVDGNHDLVVPLISERGGQLEQASNVTRYDGVIHFNFSLWDGVLATDSAGMTETGDARVHSRVEELLRKSSIASPEFSGSIVSTILPTYVPVPCSSGVQGVKFATIAGPVTILPSPGTLVRPGELVHVAFSAPGSGSALITIAGESAVLNSGSGLFTLDYTVPSTAAGRLDISAATLDAGSANALTSTNVVVLPSAPPDRVTASPSSVSLAASGATAQLEVTGDYESGVSLNLMPSITGTTYATESGTNAIVSVSAEGVVTAVANGQDTIIVRNGGQIASVVVTVNITNRRPSVAALADRTVIAGTALDVDLAATDPDGDALHLTGIDIPSFATLIDGGNGKGVLQLRPGADHVGTYSVTVAVADEGTPPLGAAQTLLLRVIPPLAPAVATQPQSQTIASGQAVTLGVVATGTAPLSYQWYLGTSGTTSGPIAGASSSSYTTPALTSTTNYWVRVSNPYGSLPADSNTATIRVVSYQPFTDDVLVPGSSTIRTIHITELRDRIDALRARFGLTAFAWSDQPIVAAGTVIRAQHIIDLRTALADVYAAAGRTPPTYTDVTLGAGMPMKVAHIAEIRAAVIAIE